MSALNNPDLPGAALPTGIDAAAQVIPGEDPCQLEALAADYHRQFQPAGPLERFLVDSLVHADWQLRRLRRAEAQLWHDQLRQTRESYKGLNEAAPLGHVFERARDDFHYMQRRIDSTERSYFRALKQLQHLQPPPREHAPAPELASFRRSATPVATKSVPPAPAPNHPTVGFAPPPTPAASDSALAWDVPTHHAPQEAPLFGHGF